MAANPIMENLKVCNFKSRPRILGLNSRPLKKSTMKLPVLPEKKIKNKYFKINNKNSRKYFSQKIEIFT